MRIIKSIINYIKLYFSDSAVRLNFSLALSLVLNICYIVFNVVAGIVYSSIWFVTVAVYYLIVVSVRYLVFGANNGDMNDLEYVHISSRAVGILLLFLSIAMACMMTYTVLSNKGARYPQYVLLIFLIYSVYTFVRAITGLIISRIKSSQTERLAHTIRLSCALMSFFNLQISYQTSYGASQRGVSINLLSGALIFFAVCFLALLTISKSNKELKRIQQENVSK